MDRDYWRLFWTTGMPEAWLMSREGEPLPRSGPTQGSVQGMPGPPDSAPSPLPGNMPGSLKNIY